MASDQISSQAVSGPTGGSSGMLRNPLFTALAGALLGLAAGGAFAVESMQEATRAKDRELLAALRAEGNAKEAAAWRDEYEAVLREVEKLKKALSARAGGAGQ